MIVLIIPDADGPGFPLVFGPFRSHDEARDFAELKGLLSSGVLTSEVTHPEMVEA